MDEKHGSSSGLLAPTLQSSSSQQNTPRKDDIQGDAPTPTQSTRVTCAICLEAITMDASSTGNSIRTLRCSHVFHAQCMEQWQQSRRGKSLRCPSCNMPLQGPNVDLTGVPAMAAASSSSKGHRVSAPIPTSGTHVILPGAGHRPAAASTSTGTRVHGVPAHLALVMASPALDEADQENGARPVSSSFHAAQGEEDGVERRGSSRRRARRKGCQRIDWLFAILILGELMGVALMGAGFFLDHAILFFLGLASVVVAPCGACGVYRWPKLKRWAKDYYWNNCYRPDLTPDGDAA